ncbi:FecR family protein [Neorhizobium sp. JUb45]|uniref:FecR family protein n=1 Tax=unclassified Neorhizobium TaxID=2629175 RepID=UPI0014046A7E|nr:FecR family protein [Neorhizobium sp. JUb45]
MDHATAWFVRIQSGEATAEDRAEHARWMSEPANLQEYMKVAALWSDFDVVGDPRKDNLQKTGRGNLLSRRGFLAGSATAIVAAGVVTASLPIAAWTADYSTGTGEQRVVKLADGSTASLDAETAIALDFTENARALRLIRGRVFFDVAKDPSRPFRVDAGDGSTTALGTRFAVHKWSDNVTIAVEESAVSVVASDRTSVIVRQGENVTYATGGGVGAIERIDADAETAWRRGKLIFENRPLGQVIADVNRYRSGMITMTDTALASMRVTGIFSIDNPDGVLDAITSALPVRAVYLSRYLVVLSSA